MLMMFPFEAPTIFEGIHKSYFRMPRVVKDQKGKFENDDLFRQLSHESMVKYTAFKERPLEERQVKFITGCQEGHTEISVVQSGNQFILTFNPTLNPAISGEGCDFDKELGKVHIKSPFILNGVCVVWRGYIDLQRLDGSGCLEFDECRAYIEEHASKLSLDSNNPKSNLHHQQHQHFHHQHHQQQQQQQQQLQQQQQQQQQACNNNSNNLNSPDHNDNDHIKNNHIQGPPILNQTKSPINSINSNHNGPNSVAHNLPNLHHPGSPINRYANHNHLNMNLNLSNLNHHLHQHPQQHQHQHHPSSHHHGHPLGNPPQVPLGGQIPPPVTCMSGQMSAQAHLAAAMSAAANSIPPPPISLADSYGNAAIAAAAAAAFHQALSVGAAGVQQSGIGGNPGALHPGSIGPTGTDFLSEITHQRQRAS